MLKRIQDRVKKVIENSEFLDKRAYVTIDSDGVISRKKMNYTIPAMVFCESDKIFENTLLNEISKIEREKEKKIDRLSNLTLEKLKENLVKLVIKGEVEFAKRYAKELALRDAEEFNKILFNLALMDDVKSKKALMALAMKEILENIGWDDKIGYLVISYFTKQRYELFFLENAKEREEKSFEIPEVLDLMAYKKVLNTYSYKNEKKYADMLFNWTKGYEQENVSDVEKEILNSLRK